MSQQESSNLELPSIGRDRSFWGLTITQFLGAFNDNLFKQLVLLFCIDYAIAEQASDNKYQPMAMALFALPWIFFSGVAGFVSDKMSKKRGIVIFKALEIVVMSAGMLAFWSAELWPLMAVLFLMSIQSTFFGPTKYGILPELFRSRDLPNVNGLFQMTTFLAIIFGMALAGLLKEKAQLEWGGQTGLVFVSAFCIVIAIGGTISAMHVRRTPIAQPDLEFKWSSLGIDRSNWQLLKDDQSLLGVLLVSSLFWFVGGVVQPSVNILGKVEMNLGDGRTSLISCCLGIGIAFGCVFAGRQSKQRIRFSLVTWGSIGLAISLSALVVFSYLADSDLHTKIESKTWSGMIFQASPLEWLCRIVLTLVGFSAGIFIVPLQVVLQVSPPDSQKGRMIGTMNLVNWIGILLSAIFVGVYDMLRAPLSSVLSIELRPATVFGVLAIIMIIVAIAYRPADHEL
jgi:acyl-[acyl-carrier-protein]-phospholipid O-acyltransferase/long-chain-fatty-acid--[acyl-carrier-protein] ligase